MAATLTSRRERSAVAKGTRRQDLPPQRPSEDDIRILAYRLYERRLAEGIGGDAASDWIEAERLLADELAALSGQPTAVA
jgi:hypothetical protein